MNLIEQFYNLELPKPSNGRVYTASPISGFPHFRIAVDGDGNPVLLLSIEITVKNYSLKDFRLKYLQLSHNIECKIYEKEKTSFQTFTVIVFTSQDRNLQEYFLRISETLIKLLHVKPTQEQVVKTLKHFIEIFRALTDTPIKTIQGLWAELFLIDISTHPNDLLNYWHNFPEEKFDFNSGVEKIEIKSNANFIRIHSFSSEQLNPPEGTQTLIGSVFIRPNSNGKSIQDLVISISEKLKDDLELIDKLNTLVIRTLGISFEQSNKTKFDYQIALDSLQFYKHEDVKKIERINIPEEVTEVRFKSDLTSIKSVNIGEIYTKGVLFNAI
ncbi:MAG: PD-(D/E)XK motif protein [Bacteroidales bacterium]|jgi:hypothetical protein|nr:PD-(D/E)XK motif protein [Bacteroidales bacterium]